MPALTTLAAVKAYLVITTSGQDALISSLIARESEVIERWTNRTFPAVSRTLQRLDGTGSDALVLPDSPVLSVSYVAVDNVEVPLSDGTSYGYAVGDTAIFMIGGRFPAGRRNVTVSWVAGYDGEETAFVPAGNTPTLTPSDGGRAVTDQGVVNAATGAVLVAVGNAPVAGQYSFADGVYSFNAANAGLRVTMSYWAVPGPVEQCCIEMVGGDLKQRDNIGVKSKSMAGETITYSSDGLSTGVQQVLKMYRKYTPC